MALSANTGRRYTLAGPHANISRAVAASARIYQGSAVGDNGSGYARPLTAGDVFLGFSTSTEYNNSSGSAGDLVAELVGEGIVHGVAVTGASAIDDVNEPVYLSDDGTFTLSSSGNSLIGKVVGFNSSTSFDVFFQSSLLSLA